MPTYQYLCNNCEYAFEIEQSIKDAKKRKCPECKKSRLKRLIGAPMIFVKGEPQTIGHWAERNTEKMSKYELGDKMGEQQEAKDKAKKGTSRDKPWYKKHGSATKSEISKMSDDQKAKYVKDGTK